MKSHGWALSTGAFRDILPQLPFLAGGWGNVQRRMAWEGKDHRGLLW